MTDDGRDGYESSPTPRRPRVTVAELRRRMLDAALELVTTAGGLTVSLAHLNMEEIIRRAGVPRSSVYREWDTKEDFYVELMIALTEPDAAQTNAFDMETVRLALAAIEDNAERLGTLDGRRAVLHEAIRVAAQRNYFALSGSLKYQTISALVAALPAFDGRQRDAIAQAIATTERHFNGRMAAFYEAFLPQLGYRMRPEFTWRHLAASGAAVVEGMARRNPTAPEVVNTPVRFAGLDGEPVDWHLAALTFLGVIEFMTEPIPGWEPTLKPVSAANPGQW